MQDRTGKYHVVVHDARDQNRFHSTHASLFAAAKAARALNNEHRAEYCYVWGESDGTPYNPRYCRPEGERFGSPG